MKVNIPFDFSIAKQTPRQESTRCGDSTGRFSMPTIHAVSYADSRLRPSTREVAKEWHPKAKPLLGDG
ncbi:MAG TPA: hypothetical protein VMG82_25585 [Candidatus Sulfotelmatobacter sp.]|nr:hypothetical protein [Candidatus Sulfotelmatobacter sp.]